MKTLFALLVSLLSLTSPAQTNSPASPAEQLATVTSQLSALKERRTELDRLVANRRNAGGDATVWQTELDKINEEIRPLSEKQARLKAQVGQAAKPAPDASSLAGPITALPAGVAPTAAKAEPDRLRIMAILENYGFLKCQSDKGEVMVANLPASITQQFTAVKQMEDQVARFEDEVDADRVAALRADANAPTYAAGTPAYVNRQMARRKQANNMVIDATEKAKDLRSVQANLQKARIKALAAGSISAVETGQKYAGLKVYRYLGPYVEPERPDRTFTTH